MSDSILSRWREHFCVLTKTSIHSYRNRFGSRKVSKILLSDICDVQLIREKGQLILCIEINKMKRIMFRAEEGIRVWYNSILTNIAILKKNNYRRFFSAEYHQNRPRMGINSLTYAIQVSKFLYSLSLAMYLNTLNTILASFLTFNH